MKPGLRNYKIFQSLFFPHVDCPIPKYKSPMLGETAPYLAADEKKDLIVGIVSEQTAT